MKYKCKDCEHVFESDQTVFECPQCGGTNIVEDGNFCTRNKKICRILAAVITVIILLLLIPNCKDTKVFVDYNQQSQRLEVELEGEEINQYNIIVTRDGSVFSIKKYKNNLINFVFDVPGEYRLQVKFIGQGKMPEISTYNKGPWIIQKPEPPKIPQILEVRILDTNTNTRTYKVKINTNVSIVSLSNTEFSINNSNYQSSNIFNDLRPGFYTFYAKNTDNDSVGVFQMNLPDPPQPITDAKLNELLRRIANGDTDAFDRWRREVDGAQPKVVVGVKFINNSYELAQDAITQNKVYTVHTQRDSNKNIIKIIVN